MDKEDLVDQLSGEGWSGFKFTTRKGLCAMKASPSGGAVVAYGLDEFSHLGTYSFDTWREADVSLKAWDGSDDIEGNWLLHQGSTRYKNPNYAKINN